MRRALAALLAVAAAAAVVGGVLALSGNPAKPRVVAQHKGLPEGVTLQPIDGGSCTTSAGPCYDNYYCSHRFTDACNSGGAFPGKSWDDPSFFPISQMFYYCSQPASEWLAEGLTVADLLNSDCSPSSFGSTLASNKIWLIGGGDQYTLTHSTGFGPETVGWHMDEPATWDKPATSQANAMTGPVPGITSAGSYFAGFTNRGITGRFLDPVFTPNQFPNAPVTGNRIATGSYAIPSSCGSVANNTVAMQSVMSCTSGLPTGRHMDVATLDTYWFANSGVEGGRTNQYFPIYCSWLHSTGNCTAEQIGRASNYGDAIDVERAWTAPPHIPSGVYTESGNGLGGSRIITPAELNWADWDQIVHGARMLLYFYEGSNVSNAGFPATSVGGTTNAAQATATNYLVENLAPIINSPFALNFATNSIGGYVFPTEHLTLDNGLDMSVHYYTGSRFTNSAGTFGPGFYIFVSVRGSESQTRPITSTFTLPSSDTTATGTVQDVCACSPTQSTGSVSYSPSAKQFTETFNKVSDVHIIGPFR